MTHSEVTAMYRRTSASILVRTGLTVLLVLTATLVARPALAQEAKKPPNIIFILADDLGWGDVGCYGQKKIKTPRLDRMARQGVRFTQFYAGSPVCAPSRCVLMTGLHSGHAFIRNNKSVEPEGQHPIPADTITIAQLLKRRGYVTGMIGKWGLGPMGSTGDPLRHGFDHFYGYNCQAHAHSFYPRFLWRNDKHEELAGNDLKSGPHYSHDLLEADALKFIRKHKDQSFFLYLPFTIPHVALQVPEDSLKEYVGQFPETPYKGNKGYQPHATPRAAYAAMITRLDRTVGRILDLLSELGLDENTIVLFSSDNGPTHDGAGGADCLYFNSNGPWRGFKGSLFEGGVRVPMIARWPGRIPAGRQTDHIGAFQDVLPTLCELGSAARPKNCDGISFVPTLLGKGVQQQHDHLYFEFAGYGGQQALRLGDWKAIRQNLHKGNLKLQLFDLATDPGEQTDVAARHAAVIANIERIMAASRTPSPDFPIKVLDRR